MLAPDGAVHAPEKEVADAFESGRLPGRGILGANSTFMHMNALDEEDRVAVAGAGMSVVWHPGNYLFYWISRDVPSADAGPARGGRNLAFETDIAKAWTFGDLGWLGYLVARMGGEFLSAGETLAMQARGGARAVGLDDRIGSLEPGKRADIVIRTVAVPEAQPGFDPVREAPRGSRHSCAAARSRIAAISSYP